MSKESSQDGWHSRKRKQYVQSSQGRNELGMSKEQRRPVGGRVWWREFGDVAGNGLCQASWKSRSRKLLAISMQITQ